MSRQHSANFEAILEAGIEDGSVKPCNVRMTGNAIMGSINWIPKWYHGDPDLAQRLIEEFHRKRGHGFVLWSDSSHKNGWEWN